MKPAISVEGISKQYRLHRPEQRYKSLRDEISNFWKREKYSDDRFWAVKDVTFDVEPGTIVGVLGRNGAGKSTLLKLLSRITRPTEGRAVVRGRLGSLLEVGSGFHPELSGRENVFMNGSIIGMRKAEIERRFDEIVAFAEVEKFIDQPVKHYSSGMYMRLAFAVAAHLDTEILLIDEVLAVGDAAFQRKCLGKVGNVARDGRTVLFVSHNMAAVQSLCDSALRLAQGTVVGIGDTTSQIEAYLAKDQAGGGFQPQQLSRSLRLAHFDCSPNPATTGSPVEIGITLEAQRPMLLSDLSVLLYSQLGVRVGIVDFRERGSLRVGPGSDLNLSATLAGFPLVEGEYSLGLYVNSEEGRGNHLDLDIVSVRPSNERTAIVPYAAHDRGLINLAYEVH